MKKMIKHGQTRALLKDHNLAPKKRFGQNFLVHRQTAEAIANAGQITAEDVVVEVILTINKSIKGFLNSFF